MGARCLWPRRSRCVVDSASAKSGGVKGTRFHLTPRRPAQSSVFERRDETESDLSPPILVFRPADHAGALMRHRLCGHVGHRLWRPQSGGGAPRSPRRIRDSRSEPRRNQHHMNPHAYPRCYPQDGVDCGGHQRPWANRKIVDNGELPELVNATQRWRC